jgi:ABC-type sugar transport system permease subunit
MISPHRSSPAWGITPVQAPSSDFWNALLRTLELRLMYIPLSLVTGLTLALGLTDS